jgi:hypothetical protein
MTFKQLLERGNDNHNLSTEPADRDAIKHVVIEYQVPA